MSKMEIQDGTDPAEHQLHSIDSRGLNGFSQRNQDVPPEVALFPPARPCNHVNIADRGPREPNRRHEISMSPIERQPLQQLNKFQGKESSQHSACSLIDCGETTAQDTVSLNARKGKKRSINNSSATPLTQEAPLLGRLKPRNEKVIIRNYEYLKLEVDAKNITGYLLSKFVISPGDKEEINSKVTQSSRTECLLDRLLKSGPGQSFDIFMEALKTIKYLNAYRKLSQDLQMYQVKKMNTDNTR